MGIIGDISGAINDRLNARKPPSLGSIAKIAEVGDYIYISYTQHSSLQDILFQYCYGNTDNENNWKTFEPGANSSGSGTKYWQIPYVVAEGNPNGRNVEVYVRIKAFYEGDDIGAEGGDNGDGVRKIDVYIPYIEEYKPTLFHPENTAGSWESYTSNDSVNAPFKYLIIQNISKVKIRVWAKAKYGATITECRIYISPHNGIAGTYITNVLLNDGIHQPYFEIETGTLKSNNTLTVQVRLTDSRGSKSNDILLGQIPVNSYQSPKIVPTTGKQEVICRRCDSGGAFSDYGDRFYIECRRAFTPTLSDFSASPINEVSNASRLEYRYKKLGTSNSEWGEFIPLSLQTLEYASIAPLYQNDGNDVLLEGDAEYQVEIHLVDDIGNEDTFAVGLSNMPPTFHLGTGGLSIGVGMEAVGGGKRIDIADGWEIYHNGQKVKITYDDT